MYAESQLPVMSTEDADVPDMVGKMRGAYPMAQMSVFGYIIAALVLVIMLPLLPFVALYIGYSRLAEAITG